jgi:hypothetical protein
MARVIVYDFAIQGLFDPGESAVEWTKDVIDTILARAENLEVPRGGPTSGRIRQGWKSLARSHKSTGVLRRGPYGAGGAAYNDAPHAKWVHNGTVGPILPSSGNYLALPVAPGTLVRRANDSYGRGGRRNRAGGRPQPVRAIVLVGSVSGQSANPWLKRAGDGAVAEFRAKPYYRGAGARSSAGFRTP